MPALAISPHRRSRLLRALAIIVALGAAGAACDSGGDRTESPAPPTIASPTAPTLTCGPAAPDGSTVAVVESGFWVATEGPGRPDVTYGAVLENTSTAYLAILTLLTVQLTDADGNRANDTARTPPSDPAQAVQTIFPGQRIGIGDQVYLDRQGVEEMTVDVGESTWMPVEQVRDVGMATAADIDFERISTDAARIGFQVVPTVDPRQNGTSSLSISDAQSWAIFRDEDGAIVGGGLGSPGTSWGDPGQRGPDDPITGEVQVSRVPDGAVDASTEVYTSPLYPPYSLSSPRPC